MSSIYPPFGGSSARRCLRCGMSLPPNVVNCGQCGAYNALPQPNAAVDTTQARSGPWGAGQPGQEPFGSGQYPGQQWGQPPLPPRQGMPPQSMTPGNAFPPQSQFSQPSQPLPPPNNNFGMPGQLQPLNFSNGSSYGGPPQQNMYPRSPTATLSGTQPGDMNGSGPSEYQEPPEEKRGPRVSLIVGIALLLVVLVGSGFGGYFFVQQLNQSDTAGAKSKPTVITTPTLKPLFSDSFTGNATGWDLTSNAGQFSVKVGGGSMVLEDDENKLLPEVLPGKSFSDFRLDVDAALTKGDKNNGYGVYIRAGSSQGSDLSVYYRFELYGDGSYAVFKGSLNSSGDTQNTKVQGYIANTAIAVEGQINHITIMAKGAVMTFMVNGQTLYTYQDNSYKGGAVALFVSNVPQTPPGAQATFSHLAIFPLTQA